MQTKGARYRQLDGLRGVCALFVLFFHCDLVLHTGHLLNHGYLSVDTFFVLSGFVIAHVYEERLRRGLAFVDFLRARAKRLVPVHWLGTAIVAAVMIGVTVMGTVRFVALSPRDLAFATGLGLLLIPNLLSLSGGVFPINSPLWSLCDEWIVNAGYARFLYRASTLTLLSIAVSSLVIVAVFGFMNPFGLCIGTRPSDFFFGLVKAVYGFITGVLVYRAFSEGKLEFLPSINPVIIYSVCFFIACIPTPNATPIFDLTAIILLPGIVAVLARSEREVPAVFVWLGRISYPLYVSHFAILVVAMIFLDDGRHSVLYAVPITAAALLLAWAIERATEGSPRPAPVAVPKVA